MSDQHSKAASESTSASLESVDYECDFFEPHLDEDPEYYNKRRVPFVELLRSGDIREFNKEAMASHYFNIGYGTDLSGLDLQGAMFRNASLCGCNFTGSDLRGSDFTDARLEQAIFKNADLRGTIGLTRKQLESSIGVDFANLPSRNSALTF